MGVTHVVVHGCVAPWWVDLISVLQLLIIVAFLALAIYAGWKLFRFLRKWNP